MDLLFTENLGLLRLSARGLLLLGWTISYVSSIFQNMDLCKVIILFISLINCLCKMKTESGKLFQNNIIRYDYEFHLNLNIQIHWIKFHWIEKIFLLNYLSKIKAINTALLWQVYVLLLLTESKKLHAR